MTDFLEKINEVTYEANKSFSENLASIPSIGQDLLEVQKFFCDNLINPIVIGGTHSGCDAVNDVYHGLSSGKSATHDHQQMEK